LIEDDTLSIVLVSVSEPVRTPGFHMYFIGVMKLGNTPPAWAMR
jgi:hypothetical protein